MGNARRRGTYEERKAKAMGYREGLVDRVADELEAHADRQVLTPAEHDALVADAAEAVEQVDADELERYAAARRRVVGTRSLGAILAATAMALPQGRGMPAPPELSKFNKDRSKNRRGKG
jgi:hypothetical protein